MNQFIAESNTVTVNDPVAGTLNRKPVLVLMSDGAPTVGCTNFTAPSSIGLGDGTYTDAALGFVSQLSSAYAKSQIEAKYGTTALFYTLGLGISSLDNTDKAIATSVLDPNNANGSTAVNDFWTQYNSAKVGETVTVKGGKGKNAKTVTKIETTLTKNYVDEYFEADGTDNSLADDLKETFKKIVDAIQLQSGYFPTLIAGNEDVSGYVSFVDRVGQYMEVTDVKGILINNTLFSGADLASNFVPGGASLGTIENPTDLGHEMVSAVRTRLKLADDDTTRTLISLAYENGQLSYNSETGEYSNYIGWYANAAGQFLGFYQEGVTVLPEATGDVNTDAVFTMKSYGYLGAVDESHGVSKSDMMYATVQISENINTGEQLVAFAVPAALIPIVTYEVTLDQNGALSNLSASGAQHPIRLVYEVALEENITPYNVKEIVSDEYLADEHIVNTDGSINFYTNQWDHQNTTAYGTVNTYTYFNPSRLNERYYYLEDAPVYSDSNGTLYTGTDQPSGTMYRGYKVYTKNGGLKTEIHYRTIPAEILETAVKNDDGSWYIPKGTVFVNLDGYVIDKAENSTNNLSYSNIPFVDTHNHSLNDEGWYYYVGATLGNNGKLTLTPDTRIKLTKAMADGVTAPMKSQ